MRMDGHPPQVRALPWHRLSIPRDKRAIVLWFQLADDLKNLARRTCSREQPVFGHIPLERLRQLRVDCARVNRNTDNASRAAT